MHVFENEKCLSCNLSSPEGKLCTHADGSFSKNYENYVISCYGPDPYFTSVFKSGVSDIIISDTYKK